MPPTASVMERRRSNLAEELAAAVEEIEAYVEEAGDKFDAEAEDYVALREKREKVESGLSDMIATINARTHRCRGSHAAGNSIAASCITAGTRVPIARGFSRLRVPFTADGFARFMHAQSYRRRVRPRFRPSERPEPCRARPRPRPRTR